MKKLLALVLALTLVFGTFGFAVAAPADVAGTDYEESVERLSGLGVIAGYPDGTFKPENTITRAEFAVVVVKLLGLADAAAYAGGDTGFYDVPADNWASGYVNIAVNRGIIKGYPDGSFGPNNPVSYAEAVTMLVRVLGYGPAADDEGTWPANYIAKAAELGVTDGVNYFGGAAATRGNIALMADNSLEVPMMVRVGYGDEATYEVPKGPDEQTLLNSKIKAETVKAVLTETYLTKESLDEDELEARKWNETTDVYEAVAEGFDVAEGCDIDFSAFIGEEVSMWLNSDDEVFFIERKTSAKNLLVGVIDAVDPGAAEDNITIVFADGDDADYDFAAAVDVWINFQADATIDVNDLVPGMYVKAILNDGEVDTIVATGWSVGIVDEADEDDEEIDFKNGGDLDLEDMEYDLDLGSLEEDMLVYYYSVEIDAADGIDEYFFEVFEGSEIGELEEYKSLDYVVVGGEKYELSYALVGDNGFSDITGLLGDEVEVFFGMGGKVARIELDTAADEEKDYALVADVSLETDKYGSDTAYIKLLTAGGSVVEYAVSDEAIITEGTVVIDMDVTGAAVISTKDNPDDFMTFTESAKTIIIHENFKEFGASLDNPTANTLVKFALNKDGEIDELEVVGTVKTTDTMVDKDDKMVGPNLFVEDDTLVFDAYNEEVIAFTKLKEIEYDIKYVDDDADLEVFVVYSDDYAEDTEYAVYLSMSNISDGQRRVKLMVDGEEEYFNTDMSSGEVTTFVADAIYKGKVFSVEFTDGEMTAAATVAGDGLAGTFTADVTEVSTSKNRIQLSGVYYLFADDVQVYEYTLKSNGTVDTVEVGDTGDLDDGQEVNVILDDDGYVEYVFIIDDDNGEAPAAVGGLKF